MKPRRKSRRQIEAELNRLLRLVQAEGEIYDATPEEEREETFTCPGIGRIGTCTNTAAYLADKLNGEVYGYYMEDNPTAWVARDEGGHDFALIDDRWLVDFWAYQEEDRAWLYDLEDRAEAKVVADLYGDPTKWEKWSAADRQEHRTHIENYF